MRLTSWEFLCFLAVLFPLYYLLPKRAQKPLLLLASLAFYACSGWGGLCFLLITAVTVYGAGRLIGSIHGRRDAYLKAHKAELSQEERRAFRRARDRVCKRVLALCLLLNLGILIALKYAAVLPWAARRTDILMPLGISFYTLQALGYLIDVYRGEPAEKRLWRFVLFVGFFPQLVQGPIGRYGALAETLYAEHPFDRREFAAGAQRVLWGFFKKLVIADRLYILVSEVAGDPAAYRGAYVFVLMVLYTLELYADFTGGIDVTIGVARMLGVTVGENFKLPYFSTSLKEYWRRWHISMCSWFRDYLFYPVSTSGWMRKLGGRAKKIFGARAGRRVPVYVSSFLVWLATGAWHGANWNFVVWGLCNWAVLMISEELEPLYKRFRGRFAWTERGPYRVFTVLRTMLLLVCCMNLFDCYATLGETAGAFFSMFTVHNWGIFADGALLRLGLTGADFAVVALSLALVLAVGLLQRAGSVRERIARLAVLARFGLWFALFAATLVFGVYGIGYDAGQFIYNRF